MDKNLKLVAVTKNRSVPEILEMLRKHKPDAIGENRLEEAEEKLPHLKIEKHFIGKLQSRKIPKIVELFDVIQSVESLKQAEKISAQGRPIRALLQINISGLPSRGGAIPEETPELIQKFQSLPNIELIGVMGIASQDPEKARQEFRLLKSLQGDLPECSMGMSDDQKIAIEEGSTMLRLGRALFLQ